MYRHQSFRSLSREHHFALRYAKRLTGLAATDFARLNRHWPDIRLRFARYWAEALAPHFRLEEEELPLEYLDVSLARRLTADHEHLGALFRHLMACRQPDPKILLELGESLAAHARWEEQELFEALQARVPPEILNTLATRAALMEGRDTDLGWIPPDLMREPY